jgi:6-phosphofructokinase 1
MKQQNGDVNMKRRIGILTSGGDCPGLNATIRGVAKACFESFGEENVQIVGIQNGYYGLINNIAREMDASEFSGILTQGGTILGTKRQPFKMMTVIGEDNVDKVKNMKQTYKKLKLDCLLTLGGNGTHKTSKLLADEGLNIIGLPKTIDNDIYGTDVTFGFHTAVDIATDAIDRLHTTAASHSRILFCEIMGNKAGWLTVNAGIAGGADVILIPEIPYDITKVAESLIKRAESGKGFSIVAVAEGAFDVEEAKMKKKERAKKRSEAGILTATSRIAAQIQAATGIESIVCVPGHMLRGGSPSAYDRILATKFGVHAAELIKNEDYGKTVAMVNSVVTANRLEDIAGLTKFVDPEGQIVQTAKKLGVSFGD